MALSIVACATVTRATSQAATDIVPCPGDCDGDGHVSVGELVTGVRQNMGVTPSMPCDAFDPERDGIVSIDELVRAIVAALGKGGCGLAPSDPPPPADDAVSIDIGSVAINRGTTGTVPVTLRTGGHDVVGTQNYIFFDAMRAPIAQRPDGRPVCRPNPDINKNATSFNFYPPACIGTDCQAVVAVVLSTENLTPIPDGAMLYTCEINVSDAEFEMNPTLHNRGVGASDALGQPLPVSGTSGRIDLCSEIKHRPPIVSLTTEPRHPVVGDTLTLRFNAYLEGGLPQYGLLFDNSILSGMAYPTIQPQVGPVEFRLTATAAGTTTVKLQVSYETVFGCSDNPSFSFVLEESPPFTIRVAATNGSCVDCCLGDCDSGGTVTVDELIRMINIALGTASLSTCETGDKNRDGIIDVPEIIATVQTALDGCVVPDLVPAGVHLLPCPGGCAPQPIELCVANRGSLKADHFLLALNDGVVAEVSDLVPQAESCVATTYPGGQAGEGPARFSIDADHEVVESDESNNDLSFPRPNPTACDILCGGGAAAPQRTPTPPPRPQSSSDLTR
jgi:hypothetical protein